MNMALRLVSWLGMVLTMLPALIYLGNGMSLESVKTTMIIGMVLWFLAAPFYQRLKASKQG